MFVSTRISKIDLVSKAQALAEEALEALLICQAECPCKSCSCSKLPFAQVVSEVEGQDRPGI